MTKRSTLRQASRAVAWVCLLVSLTAAAQQTTPPAGAPSPAAPPAQKADDSYVIGPADLLAINVWKEAEISRSIPVRSDGRISLPLIGEVQAAGRTPRQLQEELAKKLSGFISEPDVTVIVQEIHSQKFNVLGQVGHAGTFLLTDSTTVLDAIALAGGFRDFAKQKAIYILRQNPDGTQSRLAFNYKDVVKGKNIEQNIKLLPKDTVVIP
jgi:polysaccharide export outer membrane protein